MESDHDDDEMRWQKSKDWDDNVRTKPLLKRLGDLVWKSHGKRGSVASEDVGLNTEPEFEIQAGDGDKFLDILLDALPLKSFFRNILVLESKRYAASSTEEFTPGARTIPANLFTVGNFLRLFACLRYSARARPFKGRLNIFQNRKTQRLCAHRSGRNDRLDDDAVSAVASIHASC